MNATQKELSIKIAQNQDFVSIAMNEAFEMISASTGIAKQSLINQFPENEKLQKSVAKCVALAAKVLAEELA